MGDISFVFEVIKNNTTVPVILTNEKNEIISFRNLDSLKASDPEYLRMQLKKMSQQRPPIIIALLNGQKNYIYYKDSTLLTQLRYYPFFQLAVIGLFLFVSYLAFNASRNAEQNQVWIGMAKETAHQLGTPISSLRAWIELLKMKGSDKGYHPEIEKDLERLQTIADRFSKIGSAPKLKEHNLLIVLEHAIDYIKNRTSEKVKFRISSSLDESSIEVPLNIPLFEWVVENLFKNAIDAMNGAGNISVHISNMKDMVYIDISDTGKGIPKSKFKTIFKPGYTTKSRGWGLGLTLVKRIVEDYHAGQIFVKQSEINKGTTFRIILHS
jgi:two-component system, sporulation sensor kinase D